MSQIVALLIRKEILEPSLAKGEHGELGEHETSKEGSLPFPTMGMGGPFDRRLAWRIYSLRTEPQNRTPTNHTSVTPGVPEHCRRRGLLCVAEPRHKTAEMRNMQIEII